MNLTKMRFKGFGFEHNPETLRVTSSKLLNEQNIVGSNPSVQSIGRKCRTVTGKGQFYGSDCLRKYTELLKLQCNAESGILSLPQLKPMYAFFKKLELSCDPTPELICFEFEFTEDSSKLKNEPEPYYYTVSDGETLWDIAFLFNEKIESLVALNPEIKRVDELAQGQRVRVC